MHPVPFVKPSPSYPEGQTPHVAPPFLLSFVQLTRPWQPPLSTLQSDTAGADVGGGGRGEGGGEGDGGGGDDGGDGGGDGGGGYSSEYTTLTVSKPAEQFCTQSSMM